MRKTVLVFLLLGLFSCQNKDQSKPIENEIQASDSLSVAPPKVGADQDAHGCKASAGYTWSELKGRCVRIFEVATALAPQDSAMVQMPAFVIFDGDRAELFIQTEKPLILRRKAEGDQFENGAWQLIPWKGYVLKKDGKILYAAR